MIYSKNICSILFGGVYMYRTVLHSDCNSFYASVECLKHPELRGKPVAVGGDAEKRHGIVLAKNQLAKDCGIRTGETLWQARAKCPALIILPPAFEDYIRFSDIARKIYGDFTDRVEPFGLDEAWLDVTGDDGVEVARKISRRIKFELGITVSIGVSFNKVFAKMGSDYRKPDAITVISPDNYRDVVWPLKTSAMICVGDATERRLNSLGIRTLGELANAPHERLSVLGKNGEMLRMYAAGMDSSPVRRIDVSEAPKSIGNSVTLSRDIMSNEEATRVLSVLADSVGRRLREQGLYARCVSVGMRDKNLFSFTRRIMLPSPTDLTDDIHRTATKLVAENYFWRVPMRSIGITLSELCAVYGGIQTDIFSDTSRRIKMEKIEKVSDRLKERFGNKCIQPASLLTDKELTNFDPGMHTVHPVGFY